MDDVTVLQEGALVLALRKLGYERHIVGSKLEGIDLRKPGENFRTCSANRFFTIFHFLASSLGVKNLPPLPKSWHKDWTPVYKLVKAALDEPVQSGHMRVFDKHYSSLRAAQGPVVVDFLLDFAEFVLSTTLKENLKAQKPGRVEIVQDHIVTITGGDQHSHVQALMEAQLREDQETMKQAKGGLNASIAQLQAEKELLQQELAVRHSSECTDSSVQNSATSAALTCAEDRVKFAAKCWDRALILQGTLESSALAASSILTSQEGIPHDVTVKLQVLIGQAQGLTARVQQLGELAQRDPLSIFNSTSTGTKAGMASGSMGPTGEMTSADSSSVPAGDYAQLLAQGERDCQQLMLNLQALTAVYQDIVREIDPELSELKARVRAAAEQRAAQDGEDRANHDVVRSDVASACADLEQRLHPLQPPPPDTHDSAGTVEWDWWERYQEKHGYVGVKQRTE